MSKEDLGETRQRVLIAAESLFAEYGCNGVTLRQITSAAKANLAAVNYHYSDKQSLYREILLLRLRQINQRRLANLTSTEAQADGSAIPLPALLDAMARPLFEPDPEIAPPYGLPAMRLLGRMLIEPLPFTADILTAEFQPIMTRFGQAIRRHAPGIPPADFLWRLSFVVGAMHHALAALPCMSERTAGICANDEPDAALRQFIPFALNALTFDSQTR